MLLFQNSKYHFTYSKTGICKHGTFRIKLLLVAILLCVFQAAEAQREARITGVVTDAKTGLPIPYASVHYQGKTAGTTTDYEGKFSVVRINDALLDIAIIGYGKQTVKVTNATTTHRQGQKTEI